MRLCHPSYPDSILATECECHGYEYQCYHELFELLLFFLDKLERGVTNADQRVLLLNYRTIYQKWTDSDTTPFSLTEMQLALTELEARIMCLACGSTDHTARHCPTRRIKQRKPKQIAYQATATVPSFDRREIRC